MGGQGSNSSLLTILIVIIPIAIIIWFIYKKRKKSQEANSPSNQGNKSETNEVWSTIKKHLKEIEDYGKEVIDSYVVRRADPHNTSQMTKEQRIAYRDEMKKLKELKVSDPIEYKKAMEQIKKEKRAKPREIYVVLFTTRNAKTHIVDAPRAIECEVKMVQINKKEQRREINVLRKLNYDEEMVWIKPIKDKDDAAYEKKLAMDKKRQEKDLERRKMKDAKKQKEGTK
ncbi:DUF5385 family protein [Ureaplasma canigenitalium]|uniref:DUF5385 family protein n=1 Tax=Ureaplasma canigenitalium TaxID=42092 RepID=UPI0006894890|nr:DUF5385 family protein [Ureaplasma canigenitalium]